jgi:hypothetical protein
MVVEIEIFGQLGESLKRRQSMILKAPVSVFEAATLLGLNPEEVGLVTIDGVQQWMEDIVPLECRLCFFPPMSGG